MAILVGIISFVLSLNSQNIIYSLVFWAKEGRSLVFAFIFFFTSLGINYIYSVDRLVNDFHFTYGEIPDNLWIVSWKALSVIAVLDLMFITIDIYGDICDIMQNPNNISKIAQLSLPLIIIIPCLLVFVSTCLKSIIRHSFLSATAPNERWGPYDPEDTINRLLFVPIRDLKYRRLKVICKHACLLNASAWRQEMNYQKRKVDSLRVLMENWNEMEKMGQQDEMLDTINAMIRDTWIGSEKDEKISPKKKRSLY